MRVVMFTNSYKPSISGVVTSMTTFRRGLVEAGHDVFVIAPDYEDYVDEEPFIFRFPALDLPWQIDFSLALPIKNLLEPTIRGLKPTIIHSQHPVLMGDLAVAFARDLKIPLVFTFHTQYDRYVEHYIPLAPSLAGRLMDEVIQRYLNRCDHIIVPSESIRTKVEIEYRVDKPVSVVPTPVDLSMFEAGEKAELRSSLDWTGQRVLLYVGRIAKEKRLDLLLEAFALISKDEARARLVLVGRGPYMESLRGKSYKMGLSDKVTFAGGIPHEEVPRYMAAADLFVFTSTTDTQGLVLIEAMASGTPVVAVSAPGPVDLLQSGGGVLTEDTPQAFADAVSTLFEDPPQLQELSGQACAIAQRYGIQAVTRDLIQVYESIQARYA